MAVIYIDGFDHYSGNLGDPLEDLSPNLWSREFSNNNNGCPVTMPELGSLGLRALWGQAGGGTWVSNRLQLPSTPTAGESWKFGAHFYITSFSNLRTSGGIFGLGSASGTSSFTLSFSENDRILRFSDNVNTNVHVTGDFVLASSTLYHLELEIYFHNSEGRAECRVNGVPVLTLDNHDTLVSGRTHLLIGLMQAGAGGTFHSNGMVFDNLYVTRDHDWLGERIVSTLFPDADEAPQDWALSEGSDAYDLLNDVPADDDTFLESSDAGDTSRFGLTNLTNLDTTIAAIQVNFRGSKTGTDPTSVRANVHSGSETEEGTPHPLTQDQFLNFDTVFELNPDTNQPFEPGEINSLEVSIERTE